MRTFMFATLVALGLGLVGTATFIRGLRCAGTTPPDLPRTAASLVQNTWWNRYGQWCSRRCTLSPLLDRLPVIR